MSLLRNSKLVFMEPVRIAEPISWVKHIPFAFFITELHRPRIFVELGVHTGNSFSAFCQAVKALNLKCSCYGVDNFKGDPHSGFYDESVYLEINNYITENYGDFAQIMKMDFDEALQYFSDGSIDLLHIDGYHTYEAVKHDFENWIKKMSDRGVILLHDTQVRRDEFGVWKLWEELSKRYPSYEFRFGYGLGIVAIGEKAQEVLNFIEEAKKEPLVEDFFRLLGTTIELKYLLKNHKEKIFAIEQQLSSNNLLISELQKQISEFEKELKRVGEILKSKEDLILALESKLREKDKEISNLRMEAEKLNKILEEKKEVEKVKEKLESELEKLRNELKSKEIEIEQGKKEISRLQYEKEKIIEEFERLSKAYEVKTKEFNEMKIKLIELRNSIEEKSSELEKLKKILNEKEGEIKELSLKLEEKDLALKKNSEEVENLRSVLKSKESELAKLNEELIRKDAELQSIKSSFTWRSVMKWHSFIERIAPLGTKRRRWYDLGVLGLRVLASEGFRGLWRKYKYYKRIEKIQKLERSEIDTISFDLAKPDKDRLNRFLLANKTLNFPKFDKPLVSIIIPVYNKAEYTYECLMSILNHTKNIPYEVIVIDNASTDETSELLEKVKNIVVIKNDNNLGFITACNQGAKLAKGENLLFLNNDTIVTPNWLLSLIEVVKNYPNVGAVGSKLVHPTGRLQEAGSIVWSDGSTTGYGRGDDPSKPEYSYLREVDYCSAACLLVKKELFETIGGFDGRYYPAYYEDTDLCMSIWNLGYKVVYQPESVVIHYEFTSSSFEGAEKLMRANRDKFFEKWKFLLSRKYSPSEKNILYARDCRSGAKILVIDDRIPAIHLGSGYPRMFYMLKFLAELGYKVTFLPLNDPNIYQPYLQNLQRLGIEVYYGHYANLEKLAVDRAGYYDLVIVSRPHNMLKSVNILKKYLDDAALVYDAEALFSIREILKAEIKGKKFKDEEKDRMINQEINLIKQADIVIAVSEKEKQLILDKVKAKNVFVWGHPIEPKPTKNEFEKRNDILFVGGFLAHESPNEDAVLYFVRNIYPMIQRKLKNCKFYIVGVNPPESVLRLSSKSIIVKGFVKELRDYYEKCRVFVVPHRYAAGIPLKLHEAMSYGLPAVVTELIASQLNLNNSKAVLVGKNPEDFANKVVDLYNDKELWLEIRNNALEYIQRECNPEKLKKELNEIILKALELKKS